MDLRTHYLGLELAHPIVASASPLTGELTTIRQLEDAGAAAIVLSSLFEEQIRQENAVIDEMMQHGSDSFAESLSYFPEADSDSSGAELYLDLLQDAVRETDVPIIASLNGMSHSGWIDYAKLLQNAGAHALELNIFDVPTDLTMDGRAIEQHYLDIARAVKSSVSIPVALKLNPYFSAVGNMAQSLDALGIDGLVLFNRFYQPDIDLERIEVKPDLELSTSNDIRLPLLWIAVLHGHITASMAASSGVQSADEVIKYLLAGADAVMTTSALLKHGPGHIEQLQQGLLTWMQTREYESVAEMKGTLSKQRAANPDGFERANYLKIIGQRREIY